MRGSGWSYIIAVIGVATSGHRVAATPTIQDPGTYVIDRAGIIDDGIERQLEGWLRELEQKTTAQVKVLTVPTTDGEDLFSFVQRHAELWKLGRSGRDNGVLIAVAVKEREDRIHVGYGLESVLPDSWCGSLRRQTFVPHFKQGRFSDGLYQGVVAVANKVADAANVTLTGIPDFRHRGTRAAPRTAFCGAGLVPIIVLIIMVSA
ncbi:MAG: TPM domain-containing protein, partial [Planctomycetota bacterium]